MGRKAAGTTEPVTKTSLIRMTEAESTALHEGAAARGMSFSRHVVTAALGARPFDTIAVKVPRIYEKGVRTKYGIAQPAIQSLQIVLGWDESQHTFLGCGCTSGRVHHLVVGSVGVAKVAACGPWLLIAIVTPTGLEWVEELHIGEWAEAPMKAAIERAFEMQRSSHWERRTEASADRHV